MSCCNGSDQTSTGVRVVGVGTQSRTTEAAELFQLDQAYIGKQRDDFKLPAGDIGSASGGFIAGNGSERRNESIHTMIGPRCIKASRGP